MRWEHFNSTLDPEKWGWYLENNNLLPIMTEIAPAQPHLLKVIRCKSSQCNTAACSCKKHCLQCVTACDYIVMITRVNGQPLIMNNEEFECNVDDIFYV